jgi:hypothetical protein
VAWASHWYYGQVKILVFFTELQVCRIISYILPSLKHFTQIHFMNYQVSNKSTTAYLLSRLHMSPTSKYMNS